MSTSENNSLPFIGKGWSFPPSFNKTLKSVNHREGNDDIVESLQILLTTLPGERIYDAKYGCDLTPLLFEPFTTSLKTRLSERIKTAVILYEARIEFEDTEFNLSLEEGIMYISVLYTLKKNNSRYNMVFPFYLKEGTEL
jgi:phage baseplate assembly protein W